MKWWFRFIVWIAYPCAFLGGLWRIWWLTCIGAILVLLFGFSVLILALVEEIQNKDKGVI